MTALGDVSPHKTQQATFRLCQPPPLCFVHGSQSANYPKGVRLAAQKVSRRVELTERGLSPASRNALRTHEVRFWSR